jgi:multisubunit Na+/H+ antiporter MnhB subunit
MFYLYCSELSWGFFWRATLMAGIGLLSGRSKFFGFFALYELLLFMKLKGYDFKWRVRDIVMAAMVLGVMLLVSWQKISYYFIGGAFNSEQTFARPALYMTASDIFQDYFPFGCGFGSFATNASAVYYSSIYEEYGIDKFYGLSEDFPDFIADTYYPVLAQFGIVGVGLFIWFFVYIYRKMKQIPAENTNLRILVLIGIFFFLIESTSDSTFTHNRGFMFFVLMGLSVAEGIRLREHSEKLAYGTNSSMLSNIDSK